MFNHITVFVDLCSHINFFSFIAIKNWFKKKCFDFLIQLLIEYKLNVFFCYIFDWNHLWKEVIIRGFLTKKLFKLNFKEQKECLNRQWIFQVTRRHESKLSWTRKYQNKIIYKYVYMYNINISLQDRSIICIYKKMN